MTNNTDAHGIESDDITNQLPLGKQSHYVDTYNPALLCPIPRKLSRENLGLSGNTLPFKGGDIWNAYELSWLNPNGKPEVAMAQFYFPCDSVSIIESKSFKLYLNSFNQTKFEHVSHVNNVLISDLSEAAQAQVDVRILSACEHNKEHRDRLKGVCLDDLDVKIDSYQPDSTLLNTLGTCDILVQEQLFSHLFRSLCPVTGQPDWGSIHINYRGQAIEHNGLLSYLIGFRQHQDFHEQCVERIFLDLLSRCKPAELTVCAYFVRRGGLDINPYRSTNSTITAKFGTLKLQQTRLPRQ